MAILLTDVLGGLRPPGASCGWPTTDLRFWRQGDRPCWQRLQIRGYDTSGGGGPVYGVRGGWWSGLVSDPTYASCGGADPLISFWFSANSYIYLDVWTALARGLWTSSIAIACVPVYYSPIASSSVGLYVGPEFGGVPATIIPPVRRVAAPGSCANPVAWTITVRDDGSYTIT